MSIILRSALFRFTNMSQSDMCVPSVACVGRERAWRVYISVIVQDVRRWFFTLLGAASGPHSRRDYASICFAAISAAGTHAPIKYITLVLAYRRGRCGADKDLNALCICGGGECGSTKGSPPTCRRRRKVAHLKELPRDFHVLNFASTRWRRRRFPWRAIRDVEQTAKWIHSNRRAKNAS